MRGESRAAHRGSARAGTPSLVAETAGGVTPQHALERRRLRAQGKTPLEAMEFAKFYGSVLGVNLLRYERGTMFFFLLLCATSAIAVTAVAVTV